MNSSASFGREAPLVSVIMSVYNCESTVEEAVQSVIDQDYPSIELIVCDDASTDGTLDKLRAFENSSGSVEIKVITNDVNRRLAYSLNRCLEYARGEFIARMDGDDISHAARLSRQMAVLLDQPSTQMVGTSMRRFDSRGHGPIVHPADVAPDRELMGLTTHAPFCHATIVAQREVFDRVGGYTVAWRTRRAEDLDLWFKFFAAGFTGRNIPEPLYFVREDEAAVRRRSASARLGAFLTRLHGNRRLKLPLRANIVACTELVKILVPFRIVILLAEARRARALRSEAKRTGFGS